MHHIKYYPNIFVYTKHICLVPHSILQRIISNTIQTSLFILPSNILILTLSFTDSFAVKMYLGPTTSTFSQHSMEGFTSKTHES